MVSMKDIAKRCNVSVATVSKALNDYKDIGEETRLSIKGVAADMGYYPNSAARSLKTHRTYNIGVLLNDEAHSGLTHEYFSAVLEGVRVEAESRGYDITFINTHNSKMTYYQHCKYRNFDGVIIACTDFEDPEVLELIEGIIPTVTIDYIFNNCTSVISDNVKGMKELVQYVYSMGHRRIAYIHGQREKAVTRDRLAAYYNTLEELHIEINDEYVKPSSYLDSQQAEDATYELLDLKEPPTCIIYPDDLSVTGGNNAVKNRGLKVPEDISMAGYDGTKLSQMLNPRTTTVKQDTDKIGKSAARELIDTIEKPKNAFAKRIIVEGRIISGESVGENKI
ncbi:MAG: LacI family transcriptional regulator [Clostridiales bacterium]|jgi:DNA-binding LacI/PurR family transcriptional regulator|nr:LacI family transcriptional regulator [Clostridiales bacterium]